MRGIEPMRDKVARMAAYYTEDDLRSGRPLPPPVIVHPDGRVQDFKQWLREGRGGPQAAQKCHYCKDPATQSILHSEGMGYTPVCDKHLGEGTTDAEHCTPDGTRDPSNIVRVDKIGSLNDRLYRYAMESEDDLPRGPHGGVTGHDYERDPQSGAGNCFCGGEETHRLHVGVYSRGIVSAVPGEIHRGITLDLDSSTISPTLRSALETYGPESPEFIQELLRAGTGTYWSRDKGFAESVNPGSGLQVAMSADWDGNGADQLHPENTRNLPDSWGDMSLLAPQENAMREFNLKPNKELNVKSIRVRPKGQDWREVLRQPVRARTGALRIAAIRNVSPDKTAMALGMMPIELLVALVKER